MQRESSGSCGTLEGGLMSAPPLRPCPDDEVLQELAAGISSPELAEQTMQHASQCATCGPVLRRYLREFSPEESPENVRIIAQLKSSDPAWQRRLVRTATSKQHTFWIKLVPVFAALAIAIAAIVQGPTLLTEYKIRDAQKHAAAAFGDRRTTEMRLPSVAYAPYKPFPTILGPENGRSLDELPSTLHDASSAANENLKSTHPDPRWLQIQGRALLWEATPASLEKAEKDFEKARTEGLNSPSLEIDLAAAYFERDNKSDHPNLQRTLDLLNKVLTEPKLSDQDRASALYNLAIAYERTQAWDLAVATWEKYLQVDTGSRWAEEAKRHLHEAKARIAPRSQRNYSDPAFFLRQVAEGSLRPEDPEQYQQKAFTEWLPKATADKQSVEYRAVRELAGVFATHNDFWWRDFLASRPVPDVEPIKELSAALRNNEIGRHDQALLQARHASMMLRKRSSPAAAELAAFAEVYALRSKLLGASCLARAGPVLDGLAGTTHHWLQAQITLEEAQCRNFQIEFADADRYAKKSLETAIRFQLPIQQLRAIGITAGMKHQQGRCSQSWDLAVEGLQLYWKRPYPLERLDQFYAVMWQCAREQGALNITQPLLQHTLALREDPLSSMQRNSIREGMLHLRLANLFSALDEKKAAQREEQKANDLLQGTDQAYVKDYVLRSKIELAEMLRQRGNPRAALATLGPVGELLTSIQDKFIIVSYYRVLGNTQWELRNLEQATQAYQSAIQLTEASLGSMKEGDDRLAWLRTAEECYRGSVRVLLEQKKVELALDRWEWYQSRPLLQQFHAAATSRPGLPEFGAGSAAQNRVSTGLVYAVFKDGLQIWVRRGEGLDSSWISVPEEDLEKTVHEFIENCANPDSNIEEVQEQGKWLYGKLLSPVNQFVSGGRRVSVELDHSLYNLPLEALRSPSGFYFAEEHSVIYSSGNTSARMAGPITGQTPILFLDASRVSNSGHLPGIDEQRKVLNDLYPNLQILDSTMVPWAEVDRKLRSASVFIFAGHAEPDGSGTALVFRKDRSLSAKELSSQPIRNMRLAVLAACSTNKGQNHGLWDSNNLVQALLSAGVPQVVASHWDVDSATTSKLMVSFYRHLRAGEPVDRAASDARNEIMKNMPHPFYWAGFSVTGSVD
jgi:CHAT domain-containing protein